MMTNARQRALVAAVAAAVAFGIGVLLRPSQSSDAGDDVVAPVERGERPVAPAARVDLQTVSFPSRLDPEVAFNPFGALNPGAPAGLGQPSAPAPKTSKVMQVVVAPPPPPAPTAPPLPFVAIGSINGADVTGGQPMAFLQQHDQLLVVHAGQTLADKYRVDSINSQRVDFTYLPLMQRQSLPLAP